MQGGHRGVQEDARGCSEDAAKQTMADQCRLWQTMADYGRPRQTTADKAFVISMVLPASLMHFFSHQSTALKAVPDQFVTCNPDIESAEVELG